AIILNTRRTEARQPVLVNRTLPTQEFVYGESVPLAGFFQAQQPAADSGDHLRLPANNPALGVFWGKIRNRQRTAVRSNDITHPRSELLLGHGTLRNTCHTTRDLCTYGP